MTDIDWTFFSPYAHVLICLAENPRARLREVAERVGVTERTAARLVDRLAQNGVVRRKRQGRRNFYEIDVRGPLAHPIEAGCPVDQLIEWVLTSGRSAKADRRVDQKTVNRSGGSDER